MRNVTCAFVLLLAGCSPDKGPGAEPVNGATAEEAGGAMASSIESGAGELSPPSDPRAFAPAEERDEEFLPPTCFTAPTNWVDPDGDGFPDEEIRITIDCEVTRDGYDITASGAIVYRDLSPGIAGFDSVSAVDGMDVLMVGTAGSMHIQEDREDATALEATGTGGQLYVVEQSGRVSTVVSFREGEEFIPFEETTEWLNWRLAYTPGGSWNPDQGLIAGEVEIDGAWEILVDTLGVPAQRAHSEVSALTPLQVSPDCATSIVSGTVVASFSDGGDEASLIVTWTACGEHAVAYQGPAQ